ncbi:hypothetical protein, partial [Salmonella sp. s55033]|uniref:hypothetical protein n=1 Tax=Salmonella sp. s55033 TaxID=3159676 RepID=UPI00397EC559
AFKDILKVLTLLARDGLIVYFVIASFALCYVLNASGPKFPHPMLQSSILDDLGVNEKLPDGTTLIVYFFFLFFLY